MIDDGDGRLLETATISHDREERLSPIRKILKYLRRNLESDGVRRAAVVEVARVAEHEWRPVPLHIEGASIDVSEGALLAEIARVLEAHRIKRVPVVRDGRLVGIVSRADVLRGLASLGSSRVERPSADDRQIRDKILNLLKERSDASTQFVSVIVVGGNVYLWGTAEGEQDRVAIRVAAENVAGVKAVHDFLGCLPEVLKEVW